MVPGCRIVFAGLDYLQPIEGLPSFAGCSWVVADNLVVSELLCWSGAHGVLEYTDTSYVLKRSSLESLGAGPRFDLSCLQHACKGNSLRKICYALGLFAWWC